MKVFSQVRELVHSSQTCVGKLLVSCSKAVFYLASFSTLRSEAN